MIYLLLAILCSASINLGFTLVKARRLHNLTVTWFNYLTASAVSLVLLLRADLPAAAFRPAALAGNMSGRITADGSLTLALLFGAVTGVIYIAALLATQYSILRSGPSPTTMFGKLGSILPVLCSMALFGERPGLLCWAGIAVAMAALVVYNWDGGFRMGWLLPATFLLSGLAELSNKLFSAWCDQAFKPLYLLCVFGTAFLLCSLLLLREGRKAAIRPADGAVGVFIGAVNLGSAFLTIRALEELPAGVVFPALCAGVVLLIALAGRLFFQERLGKRGYAAIAMTAVSLILLNL